MLDEPAALAAIAAVFLLAGVVKGVIGLGLPTICLGLLILFVDLPSAMALLLAPSFVTNLWQACVGGHGAMLVRRLWPFFVSAAALVWIGGLALTFVDLSLLSLLLGLLLVAYAGVSLRGIRWIIAPGQEPWIAPLVGGVNGILTGMTGSFAVPGVLFLQAIGLPRYQLIQAMGILFTISTAALALSLGGAGFLNGELSVLSLGGVIPALIGVVIGQRVRAVLSEARFRQVFFWSILFLGLYIAANAVG